MMLAIRQLCLAVLLAFCHAGAAVSPHKNLISLSHHNNTVANRDYGNEKRCSWNCTIIDSDLTEEIKIAIANKKSVLLFVKYKGNVDSKCVDQMYRNSSGNFTEHGLIWLANRKLSTFTKTLESVANMFQVYAASNKQKNEIRAICVLEVIRATDVTQGYNSRNQFPLFPSGQLSELGGYFNNSYCNTEESNNLQPCLNMTKAAGSNASNSEDHSELGGWQGVIFYSIFITLTLVFCYYSPAFLCLFSPTEVIEDGVRKIVLEGASPVSFRSVIGNYLFSNSDIIWHRARIFVLRAVILPLQFLFPAIFLDYLQHKSWFPTVNFLGISHLLQPFMIMCYCCYFILTFNISFINSKTFNESRPCFVCKFFKPKMVTCLGNLPRVIINHLRIQPLILVASWRMFIRCFVNCCKLCSLVLPSTLKVSASFLIRLSVFIIFLSVIPFVTVILSMTILSIALSTILSISPIGTLCGITKLLNTYPHYRHLEKMSLYFSLLVAFPAAFGAIVVIFRAGFGFLMAIVIVFALLLSETILPFLACFVLVLYYVWSSYSAFTNKYQDLALALFKHYKRSRHDKYDAAGLNMDRVQENMSNTVNSEGNEMKIPKELFHMACEELMPIREGVCVVILKIITIVSFVFLVFSLTMWLKVGATPVMKAVMTFLTGSFPKIVAIYIDGSRQKRIEAMINDEKIPKIVEGYISGTSGLYQAQGNYAAADSDEVVILNVDGENIEMVNI